MTTVVTGATGHVGNNLVRELLSRGRRVRVVVHGNGNGSGRSETARALADLDVEKVEADVCNFESMRRAFAGADVVFHLAAQISIAKETDQKVEAVNVGGVENVVRACQENRVRRLVHMSSVHALAAEPSDQPIDETRPLVDDPRALAYDRSKARGERVVLRAVSEGLDAVIVSPASVLGPHDYRPSLQAQSLLMLIRNSVPASVAGAYNWVDVRDVVAGTLAAEERGRRGERYLLSGHLCSLAGISRLLAEFSGGRAPLLTLPLWSAWLGLPFVVAYGKLTGKPPLYTGPALRILASNCNFTNDKARRELGFSTRPLRETVGDAVSFYRQVGYV